MTGKEQNGSLPSAPLFEETSKFWRKPGFIRFGGATGQKGQQLATYRRRSATNAKSLVIRYTHHLPIQKLTPS